MDDALNPPLDSVVKETLARMDHTVENLTLIAQEAEESIRQSERRTRKVAEVTTQYASYRTQVVGLQNATSSPKASSQPVPRSAAVATTVISRFKPFSEGTSSTPTPWVLVPGSHLVAHADEHLPCSNCENYVNHVHDYHALGDALLREALEARNNLIRRQTNSPPTQTNSSPLPRSDAERDFERLRAETTKIRRDHDVVVEERDSLRNRVKELEAQLKDLRVRMTQQVERGLSSAPQTTRSQPNPPALPRSVPSVASVARSSEPDSKRSTSIPWNIIHIGSLNEGPLVPHLDVALALPYDKLDAQQRILVRRYREWIKTPDGAAADRIRNQRIANNYPSAIRILRNGQPNPDDVAIWQFILAFGSKGRSMRVRMGTLLASPEGFADRLQRLGATPNVLRNPMPLTDGPGALTDDEVAIHLARCGLGGAVPLQDVIDYFARDVAAREKRLLDMGRSLPSPALEESNAPSATPATLSFTDALTPESLPSKHASSSSVSTAEFDPVIAKRYPTISSTVSENPYSMSSPWTEFSHTPSSTSTSGVKMGEPKSDGWW